MTEPNLADRRADFLTRLTETEDRHDAAAVLPADAARDLCVAAAELRLAAADLRAVTAGLRRLLESGEGD